MNGGIVLARPDHWLELRAAWLPRGRIRINYLEAYCRANSADADWDRHTVLKHRSDVVSLAADGKRLTLRDTLADGVVVDHAIVAGTDEVDFRLVARNPTSKASAAHWAQACVRLGAFAGFAEEATGNLDDYLGQCFIFQGGKLARLPTPQWNAKARYTPGQVWRAPTVPATDVNPRPLNPRTAEDGLIGCFSADGQRLFAIAWEPFQELFQGVARCLHGDFRLGGLQPGETKQVRGKIYLAANDVPALRTRYNNDFPEHRG